MGQGYTSHYDLDPPTEVPALWHHTLSPGKDTAEQKRSLAEERLTLDCPRNRNQLPHVRDANCPEQALGIWMARMAQNFHGGTVLNNAARIHYDDSIRDLCDYSRS